MSDASNIGFFSNAGMRTADFYSFAVTCSHLLGVQNWDPNLSWIELRKLISCGLRPQLPSGYSRILASLISSCWAADPVRRPTFVDICKQLQVVKLEQMRQTEGHLIYYPNPKVRRPSTDEFKKDMKSSAFKTEEMGSEAPELIEFHITGFQKFHGVADNPTEILVGKLEEHMRKHEMPSGTQLGSCTILETAWQGALVPLLQLLITPHEGIERPLIMSTGDSQGVQLGRGLLSVPHRRIIWTTIAVRDIVTALKNGGFDVESYDAGRFVANYVYHRSLRQAQKNGNKSLFVHVPLFMVINEERQLQFIAALLKVLATSC